MLGRKTVHLDSLQLPLHLAVMKSQINPQQQLFDKLLARYDKKSELVEQLEEILHLGKDAIYRRIKGETDLTANEMILIATKFRISLDDLVPENENSIQFRFNQFETQIETFSDYIEQVLSNMKAFTELPNNELYYATQETPIFVYCMSDILFGFKMYVYGLTAWKFKFLKDKKFSMDVVPRYAIEQATEFGEIYNRIPSTDLWSLTLVDNTLNQIEYLAHTNKFESKDDAIDICESLIHILNHVKHCPEAGKKFAPGINGPNTRSANFQLYFNEMISTNNTILAKSDVLSIMYTTFGTPNFISTTNKKLCLFTENWFKDIIHESTPLSMHSGKTREWFFNNLVNKVVLLRNRLERIMISESYY